MGEGSPKPNRGGVLNDNICRAFKSLCHVVEREVLWGTKGGSVPQFPHGKQPYHRGEGR